MLVLNFQRFKFSLLLIIIVFIQSNSNKIFSQQITPILFESIPLENKSKLTDLSNVIGFVDINQKVLNDLSLTNTNTFQLIIDNQPIVFDLHKIIEYQNGVFSLLARRTNEDLVSLILTINKNKFNGSIYSFDGEKNLKIRHLPEMNENLVYYEEDLKDIHEGEPLKIPTRKDKIDHSKKGMDLADPSDTTTVDIDVLVVYTEAAETWANTNHGGIDNVIAQNFAYSQSAADNSEIYMNFNVVHSEKIDYAESAAGTDLDRITLLNDGYMDEVHALRNEHAADIVMYFSYGFDTGGLAWILEDSLGRPEYGFGLVRINYAYESATVHEMAHTMGSMHSRTQAIQPAPEYGALFEYSTGWRWDGDENKSYFSIMSYKENSDVRVPLFSNPNVEYAGAPSGSYTGVGAPSDNARSLNQIRYVIANYRNERFDGDFYLSNNGITIKCPTVYVGGTQMINGVTYTKRSADQITPENAATTCTSGITDFSYLFFNSSSFNADISHWDLSEATNTYGMFYNATSFNQDVSVWDVSRVKDFGYMFGGQTNMAFNSDISSWNTSFATNMEGMLQLSVDFNYDIGSWDVSNVTNMNYMLYGTTNFNQDLSGWCVEKIPTKPTSFSVNSGLSANNIPLWGTCANAPIRIVLSSPTNNSETDGKNVLLDWEAAESVTSYAVQVSQDNFQTFVVDEIVNDHEYFVGLESNQTYSWRVAAVVDQVVGNWSSTWSFQTPESRIGYVSQKPITLSDYSGLVTDSIEIYFSIHDLSTTDSLYSFELELDFTDIKLIEYNSISTKDISSLLIESHFENEKVRIVGISTSPIIDGDTLITFHLTAKKTGQMQFKPAYVQLNNSIMNNITASNMLITQLAYGDVDDDGDVDSFDAASVLNYSVGTNLLSAIDPENWESDRFAKADVDGDGLILAVDATHILRYVAGSIDSLPAQSSRENSIEVEWKDDMLHFFTPDSIDGFNLTIPSSKAYNLSAVNLNWETGITALNTNTNYQLGIASTKSAQGSFLQIPIVQTEEESKTIELVMYANNQKIVRLVELPGAVISELDDELPKEILLEQNYPNPFNPSTQIQYALPMETYVTLEVFNNVGQKVMELVNGKQSAGYHTTTFDASGLSSGVYLYKLTTPSFIQTKKMLLIK